MKYVFTRKVQPLNEIFSFKRLSRYNADKDGDIIATVEAEGTLPRKKQNWYLKNYMDSWCFFH